MGFQFDISFLIHEIGVGLKYVPIVLLLSVVPLIVGLIFGTVMALTRLFRVKFLDEFFTAFVVFIRGVPIILQLTILYLFFNLGFDSVAKVLGIQISSRQISSAFIATIGLSINATAYISEVIRTALKSVDYGQYEAAYSVGMTSRQMLKRIVLPQALPVAVPLLGSNFIGLIKGSAAASLISVMEVINATVFEASGNYKFLEAYVAAAVIYWALCILVEHAVVFFETRTGVYNRRGVYDRS